MGAGCGQQLGLFRKLENGCIPVHCMRRAGGELMSLTFYLLLLFSP